MKNGMLLDMHFYASFLNDSEKKKLVEFLYQNKLTKCMYRCLFFIHDFFFIRCPG
jgi:hypothetical protein